MNGARIETFFISTLDLKYLQACSSREKVHRWSVLMVDLSKRVHKGVILDVSHGGFDGGATTFETAFVDEEDPGKTYLFYTGARDTHWSASSIGLATSKDGINFRKASELNPVIENQEASFCSKEALTPAVTRLGSHYYMVLSGRSSLGIGRRIGIAHADDPKGPWRIIGELIRPRKWWEGNDIESGPCISKINNSELIVYYSNASNKWPLSIFFGPRFLLRKIGILKLKIVSPSSIKAYRYEGNPLEHLNGPKGSWNESLFCPGYFRFPDEHYIFPTASTYSLGSPPKQYIGMVADSTKYFRKPQQISILIDGSTEKNEIMPAMKGEIALDTPCPIVRENKLFLYYAAMDRTDGIWKTALTIFNIE